MGWWLTFDSCRNHVRVFVQAGKSTAFNFAAVSQELKTQLCRPGIQIEGAFCLHICVLIVKRLHHLSCDPSVLFTVFLRESVHVCGEGATRVPFPTPASARAFSLPFRRRQSSVDLTTTQGNQSVSISRAPNQAKLR